MQFGILPFGQFDTPSRIPQSADRPIGYLLPHSAIHRAANEYHHSASRRSAHNLAISSCILQSTDWSMSTTRYLADHSIRYSTIIVLWYPVTSVPNHLFMAYSGLQCCYLRRHACICYIVFSNYARSTLGRVNLLSPKHSPSISTVCTFSPFVHRSSLLPHSPLLTECTPVFFP
jgi:hypothetical protein